MIQHHYIVAYDISDPGRLRRVHRICENFGMGLQLSVFACLLSIKQLEEMKAKLGRVIKPTMDQVIFLKLRKATNAKSPADVPGLEAVGRPVRLGQVRTVIV